MKRLFLLVGLHVLFTSAASADSVVPAPWYYQVAQASFVGVVRCEVAGVVAAKYRVIESWKGAPVGSLLTIDQQFETYGAYSPFALCGEKYLACVFSTTYLSPRPFDLTRLAGLASPYWWRDAEALYYTHKLPDLLLMPVKQSRGFDQFGMWGKKVTLQAYRDSVLTFLSLPPAERESQVLRDSAKKTMRYSQYEPAEKLAARVDSLALDSLVSEILTMEIEHPRGRSVFLEYLLVIGRERTLLALRSPRGLQAFPGDTLDPRHPIRRIADREIPKRATRSPWIPANTDSALQVNRVAFTPPWGDRFMEAFTWLAEHDPESVVRWFEQDSVLPPPGWHRTTAFSLASYFAWRCSSEREAMLRRMLNAPNPTVRVAGAVYLTFEDSTAGVLSLRELSTLDGFPGAWAATVLASQGDRQAMSRALEVFRMYTESTFDDRENRATRGLQARLLVLLSNSSHASGVKMPEADWARRYGDWDKRFKKGAKELMEWWRKKGDRIQLVDPWRELYSSQRVD